MFHSARLKLTLWYVLISMLVSVLFSATIYTFLDRQLDQEYDRMYTRYEQLREVFPMSLQPPALDKTMVDDTKDRIRLNLTLVNLIILAISGIAGYVLAGRTLAPIEAALEEQDRFVSDASHELRTPLTVLRSEIEVALRDKKLTPRQARSLLESNLEEVVSLQALSESLLQLSHLENATPKLQLLTVQEILEEAVKAVEKLAKAKGIQINVRGVDARIKGDGQTLKELLVILLDNAIKYSNSASTVRVMSRTSDHIVSIAVVDEGAGIPEEALPHIFDRFYRVGSARGKERVPGYGLGLSLAQKIVSYHHGTIDVKSTIGKGTTFTLHLHRA